MPKKRALKLRQFEGSSSSSHRPSAGQDGGDSPTSSVNERLSQLRVANSLDATQRKREIAELVAQRSVPPELRGILNIPESAPPKPKVGIRVRDRERMRTPGPAAPKSWMGYTHPWQSTLTARGGKRKGKKSVVVASEHNRPGELLRFARMIGTGEKPFGLVHLTLKKLAEQWDFLDEEDFPALIDIPLRLRLKLLSYLGIYGPPIDAAGLRALTQGTELLTILDLGGLAGHAPLTLRKIIRVLERPACTTISVDEVLESWDVEDTLEAALAAPPVSRFANLTHLSLSHPPSTVLWQDLLSLSKHIPQVTHLSLAYWPRPTLTPHLATTTVSSQYSPEVRAGGTHYYSGMDQDFHEAASLLRQLSCTLLCLQWLDLEGCAEWMPALATLAAAAPLTLTEAEEVRPAPSDDWHNVRPAVMTIFTDTWKNLNYINCSQACLPGSAAIFGSLTVPMDSDIKAAVVKYLYQYEPLSHDVTNDMYDVEKRKGLIWAEREQRLFTAGRRINSIRRARSCKPVAFDFGWMQKAV